MYIAYNDISVIVINFQKSKTHAITDTYCTIKSCENNSWLCAKSAFWYGLYHVLHKNWDKVWAKSSLVWEVIRKGDPPCLNLRYNRNMQASGGCCGTSLEKNPAVYDKWDKIALYRHLKRSLAIFEPWISLQHLQLSLTDYEEGGWVRRKAGSGEILINDRYK